MYKAIEIANYIIEYEHSKKRFISNLELQKLLYFVQAGFIIENAAPIFEDDMEAWSVGPIVIDVHNIYKIHGGLDIIRAKGKLANNIKDAEKFFINEVLEEFSDTPIYKMLDIIKHQMPYIEAWYRPFDNKIKINDMIDFFCD